jgi:hypothetical protein
MVMGPQKMRMEEKHSHKWDRDGEFFPHGDGDGELSPIKKFPVDIYALIIEDDQATTNTSHVITESLDDFQTITRSKSNNLMILRCKQGTQSSSPIASILKKQT